MEGYIYAIVLGVFAVCISILAAQFVEVGKGKAPSLSLTVRLLVLSVIGVCLVFFVNSALACDDEGSQIDIDRLFIDSIDSDCTNSVFNCVEWADVNNAIEESANEQRFIRKAH